MPTPYRDLFNPAEAEKRKARGMQAAADSKSELLATAREIAVSLAESREDGITADDVIAELSRRNICETLGNAAGSLFKGGRFVWTGKRRQSARPQSHRNELKVWVLRDEL